MLTNNTNDVALHKDCGSGDPLPRGTSVIRMGTRGWFSHGEAQGAGFGVRPTAYEPSCVVHLPEEYLATRCLAEFEPREANRHPPARA